MVRVYKKSDGLLPEDLVHCGLDHLTAAEELFDSNPSHFDSAGYLSHIGVELLLKGWLLQCAGEFKGIHSVKELYEELVKKCGAPQVDSQIQDTLELLDCYEALRYPNRNQPTEVGQEDWNEIDNFAGLVCRSMPKEIEKALDALSSNNKITKSGRVLLKKKIT